MASDELERINRHLERAGAKDACLACGYERLITDPRAEVALLSIVDRELDTSEAIEAVALVCARCGFVRLHSTLQLFGDEG